MELPKKYRPKRLEDVVGQDAAVSLIQTRLANGGLPHAMLFTGNPGVGKTTMARIIAEQHLKCEEPYTLQELNIADLTSVDTVRRIKEQMDHQTLAGKGKRAWILDEVQSMGKPAQQAFLKILEEPPSHVYFLLCTTDPEKLVKAVRSRCTKVRLVPIPREALLGMLRRVVKKEGIRVPRDMLDRVVDQSEGSARDALTYLDAIKDLKDEDEMIAAMASVTETAEAIELARVLMRPQTRWPDVKPILQKLQGQSVEATRKTVLGYAAAVCRNGGLQERAAKVYEFFCEEMIQSGKEPEAHLTFACLGVVGLPRGKR